MSDSSFLWQIAQKDNNNQGQMEEYLTHHQYEQERFTDTYSEDFRDDYN
jgi:hypothetical protein